MPTPHSPQLDIPIPCSLQVTGLSCTRGERLLFSDIEFELLYGQALHITGPNGSGKTSLLRIIAGLNQADSGSVLWACKNTHNNPEYLRQSAYLGHLDGLKNELTAIENLRFYQAMENMADEPRLDRHLAQMGILHCADLPANKLSFGQRRRLAFARLLEQDYTLWILDEPFTGIDVDGRALIEKICLNHLTQGGMILLTNHQSLADSALADRLSELALS